VGVGIAQLASLLDPVDWPIVGANPEEHPMQSYIHGYSGREAIRLTDQATTLSQLLHGDSFFPPQTRVLEAGCGTEAQTVFLAQGSPEARITAVDISLASLAEAKSKTDRMGITNVVFLRSDLYNLPFEKQSFDHIFVCFVLEHVNRPVEILATLKMFLRPGGTITVIEGDHGSAYSFPRSEAAQEAIRCQVELQAKSGGNALIGRELYPLLHSAGFEKITVSPRMVYVDGSRPGLIEGFTKNTFTAMIQGVRERALNDRIIDAATFDRGIRDLYRTAQADGVFCYTFFKAVASQPNGNRRKSTLITQDRT
jgi:SAM-dependent methyltransferase